jgi:hypothetical protein
VREVACAGSGAVATGGEGLWAGRAEGTGEVAGEAVVVVTVGLASRVARGG